MPPHLGWADLRGAKVGVWGLGVEGTAAIARLHDLGVTPVLVDDAPAADREGVAVHRTDADGLDLLAACEVVVKSPGISRYRDDVRALEAGGVAVVGGVGLWMEEVDRARVVGITGTKGKSTTTSILGHLLRRVGRSCFMGGNLGVPPFAAHLDGAPDYWVVELSSYQVMDLASAPAVVVVTSLHPDHLNWHGGSLDRYYEDKLSLCRLPGAQVTVVDGTSAELRARRSLLGPEVRWVLPPEDPAHAWSAALGLRGAHNARNAALARQALVELGIDEAGDDRRLAEAAAGFESLPSRLTSLGSVDGIEFVDDSLSTNVLPTIAAVESFADRALVLIVGGFDRGIDYDELASALDARTEPTLVLGIPDNGERIVQRIEELNRSTKVDTSVAPSVEAATMTGHRWLRARGATGVVLLSPAAASFGRFGSYRERAEAFAAAMRSLE
jgi:UDP-N-acetylmuramoylalanine--D-glutamate ligase